MQKIVFYIGTMNRGGAQRVMTNLINYFATKDYHCTLITDYEYNSETQYLISDRVKKIALDNKNRGLTKQVFRVIKLRRILKSERPDVALSFLGKNNIRLLIASVFLRFKKIVSVRNDPNKEYGEMLFKRWITYLVFGFSDGVVFQTNDAANYFPKRIRRKSKVIFNPVDPVFYDVDLTDEADRIVSVGRLYKQKNHRLLIDSFARVSTDFPNNDLYIYGDGPLKNELAEYAKKIGMDKRIHFEGNVEEIEKKLSFAKLFILSSDYEGMPNALMEAMAAGVPVISTDCPCGGPRTLITNEMQGQLVKCNDVTAMANSISKLLSDESLLKTMSVEEKKRALVFAPQKIMSEWEAFMEK